MVLGALCFVGLGAIGFSFYAAIIRTRYADGFSARRFSTVVDGDSYSVLSQKVGRPLEFALLPARPTADSRWWQAFDGWDALLARAASPQVDEVMIRYSAPVAKHSYWAYEVRLDKQLKVIESRKFLYGD
jgi:hypothetical protein